MLLFFYVELFTGKVFQKKGGICAVNALNHAADKQLITSLLQKSVHHPSIAPTFYNCVQEGKLRALVESCARVFVNDHLKDGLALVMLVTLSMNGIG